MANKPKHLESTDPKALTIARVVESSEKCIHLWNYGNIAVKDKPHPRVRECFKCKAFEYI